MFENEANGSKILLEWLGEGAKPVPQDHAQYRCNHCLHGFNGIRCPHNISGEWRFSSIVASVILRWFKHKQEMRLFVVGEEELGVCDICRCKLALKVWVPFETIYHHTTDERFAQFPPYCWISNELKQKHPA